MAGYPTGLAGGLFWGVMGNNMSNTSSPKEDELASSIRVSMMNTRNLILSLQEEAFGDTGNHPDNGVQAMIDDFMSGKGIVKFWENANEVFRNVDRLSDGSWNAYALMVVRYYPILVVDNLRIEEFTNPIIEELDAIAKVLSDHPEMSYSLQSRIAKKADKDLPSIEGEIKYIRDQVVAVVKLKEQVASFFGFESRGRPKSIKSSIALHLWDGFKGPKMTKREAGRIMADVYIGGGIVKGDETKEGLAESLYQAIRNHEQNAIR